jgi:hypothetical protein
MGIVLLVSKCSRFGDLPARIGNRIPNDSRSNARDAWNGWNRNDRREWSEQRRQQNGNDREMPDKMTR